MPTYVPQRIRRNNYTIIPAHLCLWSAFRYEFNYSLSSSVSTTMGCTTGVKFPTGGRNFPLLHSVQTGTGARPVYKTLITRSCFAPDGSGLSVKLTSHLYLIWRLIMVELYLHPPPHVFMAWCYLIKHRDNFNFFQTVTNICRSPCSSQASLKGYESLGSLLSKELCQFDFD
jgi:hypothetical protein